MANFPEAGSARFPPPLRSSDLQATPLMCNSGLVLRFAAALILVLAAPLVAAFAVRSTPALIVVAGLELAAAAVLLLVLVESHARRADVPALLADPSG